MQLSGVILSQPCNCSLCFGGIVKSPAWLEQGDFNAFGGDGGMEGWGIRCRQWNEEMSDDIGP